MSKEKNRETFEQMAWDRVGEYGEHPRDQLCERCMDRPARVGFSFCLPCIRWQWCGEGKP